MIAFFRQLFLRIWSGLLLYARLDFKKKAVRCETCPRWRYHATITPAENFAPVALGVCRLSRPAIVNQGGLGFGVKLFHPLDWCPNHPLYQPAPASDLPAYLPPTDAVARNEDGTEGNGGFQRAPTLEEALRLATVLRELPDNSPGIKSKS